MVDNDTARLVAVTDGVVHALGLTLILWGTLVGKKVVRDARAHVVPVVGPRAIGISATF